MYNNKISDQSYGIITFRKVDDDILYLLVQHKEGHWGFPKGHINDGEEIIDGAKRELFEETGIKNIDIIPNKKFFQQYEYQDGDEIIAKSVTYFLGSVTDPEININMPEEIIDCAWFSYDEAKQKLTYKNSVQVFEEVNNFLTKKR